MKRALLMLVFAPVLHSVHADVMIPEYVTVSFDANGGSGYMSPQTLYGARDTALKANSFYRTGYVFAGWVESRSYCYEGIGYCSVGNRFADREVVRLCEDITLYAVWQRDGGTIGVTGSRYVNAGQTLVLTVTRSGGSGPVAVKYKAQTSTAICGQDFDYVKEILTWESGDYSSKTIYVPTYATRNLQGTSKQLRVKLSALTTGSYEGYSKPRLSEDKVYASVSGYNLNPGRVVMASVRSSNPCVYSTDNRFVGAYREYAPWYAYPGLGYEVTLKRVGGSDGYIAVKYKTQSSTAMLLSDFEYVKGVLEWGPGDTEEQSFFVETYNDGYFEWAEWNWGRYSSYYPKQMRVKLATLSSGDYSYCLAPTLPETKIYINLIDCDTTP